MVEKSFSNPSAKKVSDYKQNQKEKWNQSQSQNRGRDQSQQPRGCGSKENTQMALQTAKQKLQSVESVARGITSLLYIEAVTQPEKEVQVEVGVTKVDRLNLRVQSGYAESLSVMWLRTLNRHR